MSADRYALVSEAARALRAGEFERIDAEAVAEELDQVGRGDAHELRSRTMRILEHLLKLRLSKGQMHDENRRAWRHSIIVQQQEIDSLLEESPSLKHLLTPELIERCYRNAARLVAHDLEVEPPADCPFTLADVLPELER